jgi:hypothetical protein
VIFFLCSLFSVGFFKTCLGCIDGTFFLDVFACGNCLWRVLIFLGVLSFLFCPCVDFVVIVHEM